MIPDYNRVVLGNVSSITPQQLKQLKDNQMYLAWHYDKMPKGVIAKIEEPTRTRQCIGGAINVPLFVDSGGTSQPLHCSIEAGRVYRITINQNGVGESPHGSMTLGSNYVGGQVHLIDLHGTRIGTWWVYGDVQNADNHGIGSWIPLEALYLSTETNPNFQFSAFIDTASNTTYTPYKGDGTSLGSQNLVGFDWQFSSGDLDINFQMVVEDMGAYTNDPWQYITGG